MNKISYFESRSRWVKHFIINSIDPNNLPKEKTQPRKFRGKTHYTNEIIKDIDELLKRIDSDEESYYSLDGILHYDKNDFEIEYIYDSGNAYFNIGMLKILVEEDENGYSIYNGAR